MPLETRCAPVLRRGFRLARTQGHTISPMKFLPGAAALPVMAAAFQVQVYAHAPTIPVESKAAIQVAQATPPFVNAEVT